MISQHMKYICWVYIKLIYCVNTFRTAIGVNRTPTFRYMTAPIVYCNHKYDITRINNYPFIQIIKLNLSSPPSFHTHTFSTVPFGNAAIFYPNEYNYQGRPSLTRNLRSHRLKTTAGQWSSLYPCPLSNQVGLGEISLLLSKRTNPVIVQGIYKANRFSAFLPNRHSMIIQRLLLTTGLLKLIGPQRFSYSAD